MSLVLRPATAADHDAIVHVFLDCWRTSYAGLLPDEAITAMTDERADALWAGALARGEGTVLVAESGGRVQGVTRFALTADPGGEPFGVVHSLYVSPSAQGLGLGTALLTAAHDRLLAQGAQWVVLWVFAANTPSVNFYRSRGWLPDGTTRTQPEFGQPELRLRKTPVAGR